MSTFPPESFFKFVTYYRDMSFEIYQDLGTMLYWYKQRGGNLVGRFVSINAAQSAIDAQFPQTAPSPPPTPTPIPTPSEPGLDTGPESTPSPSQDAIDSGSGVALGLLALLGAAYYFGYI